MYMIMKIWRIMKLNENEIVNNMIKYIKNLERNYNTENYVGESRIDKTNIVNNILNALDHEVKNED